MKFSQLKNADRLEVLKLIRIEWPESDEIPFNLEITATVGNPTMTQAEWQRIAMDVSRDISQGTLSADDGEFFWSITFGQ